MLYRTRDVAMSLSLTFRSFCLYLFSSVLAQTLLLYCYTLFLKSCLPLILPYFFGSFCISICKPYIRGAWSNRCLTPELSCNNQWLLHKSPGYWEYEHTQSQLRSFRGSYPPFICTIWFPQKLIRYHFSKLADKVLEHRRECQWTVLFLFLLCTRLKDATNNSLNSFIAVLGRLFSSTAQYDLR